MDQEQVLKLKNQALVYLSKQSAGVIMEKIYADLGIKPFPITAFRSYLQDMSYKGYLSKSNISGGRTIWKITRAGREFVSEGGYRRMLLSEQGPEKKGSTEKNDIAEVKKKPLFISYASTNDNKVAIIKKELADHPLFEPFVVADRRKANSALVKLVRDGIEASYCVIPILSPQSYKEQWINQEIGYAEGVGRRIIPIIGSSVLDKLKGFVHKQNQCPYCYRSTRGLPIRDENKEFKQCPKLLIKDLEQELEEEKSSEKELIKNTNQSLLGRPITRIMRV